MKAVRHIRGTVAPLLRPNIDTDAIIPSREMKRVCKRGLGEGLFAGWRYTDVVDRVPDPEFVLNQSGFENAAILATGPNFGCGSSREHAVWALQEYGIQAVLAPSFGAIFERNCYNNGLLPIVLDPDTIERVVAAGGNVAIDLETQRIALDDGEQIKFTVPDRQREMLLNGWDPIDRTLQDAAHIDEFLTRDRRQRPWVYDL